VHPLTEGPKEENKTKPRIIEPITEITLLSPNKKTEEKIEDKHTDNIETTTFEKPEVMELHFKPESPKTDDKNTSGLEIQKAEQPENPAPLEKITLIRKNEPVEIEQQEIEKKSQERIKKLKDLSVKLRTPHEIEELENTPAYVRRNVELNEVKHSSESEVSKFTLGEDENNQPEIKSNNSFLHDNVD